MKRNYPKNYQIIMGYANLLYKNEQYDEAIRIYQKVITLKP